MVLSVVSGAKKILTRNVKLKFAMPFKQTVKKYKKRPL